MFIPFLPPFPPPFSPFFSSLFLSFPFSLFLPLFLFLFLFSFSLFFLPFPLFSSFPSFFFPFPLFPLPDFCSPSRFLVSGGAVCPPAPPIGYAPARGYFLLRFCGAGDKPSGNPPPPPPPVGRGLTTITSHVFICIFLMKCFTAKYLTWVMKKIWAFFL